MVFDYIAAVDPSSAAYQMGEKFGYAIAIGLAMAIALFFILCCVMFIRTKHSGWLIGLILTSLPVIGLVAMLGYGFYLTGSNIATFRDSESVVPQDRIVETDEGLLAIVLPEHWTMLTNLNSDASLQCGNLRAEEYCMIITEPKSDIDGDLQFYADIIRENLATALQNAEADALTPEVINGLNAIRFSLSGSIDGLNINYFITALETGDHYHQFFTWTLPSKRAKALPVFEEVLGSLEFTGNMVE